ncbi:MAG: tripartite tricarboxylate transporter substrate binding protein [Acetobacteraceae bacterium]|nr:MAG: tripartite tricarboxylate transporter substrate binding protein [Acetobacteraceae bacterium]
MVSRRGLAALAVGMAAPAVVRAQAAWPGDRPIEAIVPYPPGGGVDIMTRLMMPLVAAQVGGRSVVTNRAGAGGQLGFEAIYNAAPDGYTIGSITAPVLQAIPIERAVRYKPLDFSFLANVVEDANAFLVAGASPFQTLADVAAAARAQPGKLNYGTTGVGSDDHIAMLAFEAEGKLPPMTHVPFAGAAPAMQALLGRHVDLVVGNASDGLGLTKEGQVRTLGQASPTRWAALPDVPTFREQGFDVVATASRGFVGPPGLPAPILARLEAAFTAVLADSAFLREAERLALPLRPLVGGAYRSMVAEMDASLQGLWRVRPWRD